MNSSGGYMTCGVVLLFIAAAGIAFWIGALLALMEAAQWLHVT